MEKTWFTVYGLSTEGYGTALKALEKGYTVSIVDEKLNSPIKFSKKNLNYKSVDAFFEEENLAEITSLDEVIAKTKYILFCPKIRCEVEEIQGYYEKMLKEISQKIEKNSIIFFWIPLGENGQEKIARIVYDHSGLKENELGIIFLPPFLEPETNYIGTIGKIEEGIKFLKELTNVNVNPLTLEKAERKFSLMVLERISRYTTQMITLSDKDISSERQHYFNDIFSYYTDLKLIYYTTKRGTQLKSFSGTLLRSIESYPKNLVNYIKSIVKEKKLKPSRVRVIVLWSKSSYHVRPDFDEAGNRFIIMLQDIFPDVQLLSSDQLLQKKLLTTFNRNTCIIVACSENDFKALEQQSMQSRDKIMIIKATLPPSRLE
ncbi:MAG: hypothetical protein QXL89_02625 [Nitrososphaeria archaeon]